MSESGLITVIIGRPAEAKMYTVHCGIICNASPYFKGCLESESGFVEASEKIVRLPDDDPEAFIFIVDWAYSRRNYGRGDFVGTIETAVAACVLADKLRMEDLSNGLLDIVMEHHSENSVVKKTLHDRHGDFLPARPVRKYLLEQLAFDFMQSEGEVAELRRVRLGWEEIFISGGDRALEIANAISKMGDRMIEGDPAMGRKCDYHTHLDTPKCTQE